MSLNYKQVKSVLDKNSKIRDEHLRRNYGKYSQYEGTLNPAIGEVSPIDYNRPLYSITNGESLLNYTQGTDNLYGNFINTLYFNKDREKDVIGFNDALPEQYQSWAGKYVDYVTYLDEVLGEDIYSRHVRYVNDFLSGQFIENALRQTEVGVIRDINVALAKQGIITTNHNNMEGKDTPLGTITNFMYSNSLYNGAIFNSDRKSETKYLTPSLINQYGNNLSNVMELGDMLRVGVNEPRLIEDLGADVHIIHSFNDEVGNLNLKYLSEAMGEAEKYLSEKNRGFLGYKIGGVGYVTPIEGDINPVDLIDYHDLKETEDKMPRSKFQKTNDKILGDKTYGTYNEHDDAGLGYGDISGSDEEDKQWEKYTTLGHQEGSSSILSKTAKLFNDHKINSLVGRFHTSKEYNGEGDAKQDFIDTAKSKYGNSHGRNLLTRQAQDENRPEIINGYSDPYCRTWTYHHQYNQVRKLIRPFIEEDGSLMSVENIQRRNSNYRNREYKVKNGKKEINDIGAKYLGDNTVLGNSGFVNICPSNDENNGVSIKNCMFSIENLAWKDVVRLNKKEYIDSEQRGPNGGRIMWFPPYDLSFQENVNVEWNQNTFIGRGEKVYTYTNTDRTGSLSFTMLIDYPSIVNSFAKLDDGDISSDIDADILRYFAGCDIPEINKSEDVPPDEIPEPIPEPGIPETGEIRFKVYFPNNYSGSITEKRESRTIKENESDDLWWEYVLIGNNCKTPIENPDEWVGYETSTEGVSNNKKILDPKSEEVIGVSKCWAQYIGQEYCIGQNIEYNVDDWGKVDKTSDTYTYRYKVDKDLRQLLTRGSRDGKDFLNYKDTNSSQMNIKFKDGKRGENDYTFGEVIYALITTGNLSAKKITDLGEIVDFKEQNEALRNFIRSKANNSNDTGDTKSIFDEKVNKLINVFSANGLKIDSIDIQGCADRNDFKNSKMLAFRRAQSIKDLLLEQASNKISIDPSVVKATEAKFEEYKPGALVSDDINKINRYAEAVIRYTIPGTVQKLQDTDGKATNESTSEEDKKDQEMFDAWYTELLAKSSTIKEYDTIFDNEDFEKGYRAPYQEGNEIGLFNDNLHEWCKGNEVSYNLEDYGDDIEKWIEVLDKIIGATEETAEDGYGYEYFMPATTMSYTKDGYNDRFKERLSEHPVSNSGEDAQKEIESYQKQIQKLNEKNEKLEEDIDKEKEKIIKIGGDNCTIDCDDSKECCSGGENEEILDKIQEISHEIVRRQEEISRNNKRINEIDYELEHWTTHSKDKSELVLEKTNLETRNSLLNTQIKSEKEKQKNKELDLEKNYEKIDKHFQKISDYEIEVDKNSRTITELEEKLNNLYNKNYLDLDLTATELYFNKMSENGMLRLEDYDNFIEGQTTNYPFELEILKEWCNLPYKKYEEIDIKDDGGEVKLSYALLLHDYLVIKYITEHIENGLEFGYDYLFNSNGGRDFDMLKELLYMKYLLEGKKSDDIWASGNTEDPEEITYYTAWKFLVSFLNDEEYKKTCLDYKPLFEAVSAISSAIETYESIEHPTEHDLNKLMRVIEYHTPEVLKYCNTVSAEIFNNVFSAAMDGYNAAKQRAEEKMRNNETNQTRKVNKEYCETRKQQESELDRLKRQYLYSVFYGNQSTRYENEAEYFSKLEADSPLIFKRLKEKFKYFNPAFHSMSPEGFNARLNFLHQCTRQGNTLEHFKINGMTTANNLAFGRMPVCVLKIGDFINTKIIINSVSITYDNGGMQWDLNPEGVGVQPMFAKITLGIVLIGGQSLEGPINRLQNAISFNYYANTGVYDDRADRIHHDPYGEVIYDKVWTAKNEIATNEGNTNANVKTEDDVKTSAQVMQTAKDAYEKAQRQYDSSKKGDINCENM